MKSKPMKWLLWSAAAVVLLLAGISLGIAWVLPVYVESKLIPQLAEDFGLAPREVVVRRIGWWGADMGPLRFGDRNAPGIDIAAVQIDYSPWSLLHGRLNGIALAGLGVPLKVTAKGVAIAGLNPAAMAAAPQNDHSALKLQALLPVQLGRFSIRRSHLVLQWKGRRHIVPFDIDLQTNQSASGILTGRAEFTMLGTTIKLSASLDQQANSARLEIEAADFFLTRLSQLGLLPPRLMVSGAADLKAWGAFDLQPLRLTGLSVTGRMQDTRISAPGVVLQSLEAENGTSRPIVFTVSGDALPKLQWRCTPLHIDTLLDMAVNELQGELALTDQGWSLDGTLDTRMPRQRPAPMAELSRDLTMHWQLAARQAGPDQGMTFELNGQGSEPLSANIAGQALTGRQATVTVKGTLQEAALFSEAEMTMNPLRLKGADGDVAARQVVLKGSATFYPPASGTASTMSARVDLSGVRAGRRTVALNLPRITLTASGRAAPHRPWDFDARLKLLNGKVQDPAHGLVLKNLAVELPLKWPSTAAEAGRIDIEAMQWANHRLGGIKGTLQQHPQGLDMVLRHTSKLFPGLNVFINGTLKTDGAQITAEVPNHRLAREIDLGRFNPSAAGLLASGELKASGTLHLDRAGAQAAARFTLNKGRLRQETQKLLLDGIAMEVQFDDILNAKSAPRQRLHVDRLALGNLAAEQLGVDFQIENRQTLFIEKAGINWCQGKIYTAALRIIPDKDDYDVTLYCDRLNLAMVLEQLGAAQADGEGTVNGRIPIRWTSGHLSFDNGFLYSSPGQTGAIQITGTETMLAGLAPGTPQHTQLDIATEALKDYTYKWAKLNVQSEDNMLLLKLQFDGKPNRLLPFAYDQSLGQFKRIEGKGQADFQGIAIDLNLRSPINDLINYKELFKKQ